MPITMPKGSVVYFHHKPGIGRATPPSLSRPRHPARLYSPPDRGILRSLEPKKVDVQMLHRNSPRLAEMLGEDDWFDKLSAQGRDYHRFGYMNQLHAFTEAKKAEIMAGA